jgi:ankyrin repeat protein
VNESILGFLENKAKVSASSQAMMASRSHYGYSQRLPRQMTGLHLTTYFGLRQAMLALLKNGHHPNLKDAEYDWTPLLWAAHNGHEAVVKQLLANNRLDPNSKGTEYGPTPLLWAAGKGHEAVVKLLLKKGVNIESKDTKYGWRLLGQAAESGQEAVAKLLLEKGADVESKDRHDQTLLSWAAGRGDEAVVKLILEKGANVESKSGYGCREGTVYEPPDGSFLSSGIRYKTGLS